MQSMYRGFLAGAVPYRLSLRTDDDDRCQHMATVEPNKLPYQTNTRKGWERAKKK
jgi:hypothetical protein